MNINFLFEQISNEQTHIDEFNRKLFSLDERKRKMCTIHPTDSGNKIRKKCKVARIWGVHHAPVWDRYVQPHDTSSDGAGEGGGDAGIGEIQGTGLVYPYSIGPEDDEEFVNEKEKSSTERVRKYYRRHPEKVRKYLKDTVKDRVARNRDRRKAVKKHGKAKMKNHDVHHPKGPNGGSWRLAKKDHGRDKKNENYVYLEELLEGNVPHDSWILINEGGAAGHMAHPYEDDELTFADVKEMVRRGLVGELDAEEPVTEKLDGQNIMFTVKDGRVYFARNKGQVKNKGQNALDVAGIRQMFAGRGNIEKAFTGAAEDLQRAIDALPSEQRDKMFSDGGKFMNVEIILPDTQNVIPYNKSVLVFHGSVAYDDEGNETGRSVDDGRILSNQLTKVNAQQQKTFGIQGPKTISFSDAQTVENKKALQEIGRRIVELQNVYGLDDKSTIEDYKLAYWENRLIDITKQTGVEFTKNEFEGITRRWALGDKSFKVSDIEDPEKKRWFREFEAKELKQEQQKATRPLEQIFLQTGALSLRRVTDLLSANNPEAAAKLKQEVLDTIKSIKETGDTDKLAALQVQIERLESVGIDKIVPSEGMVFMYNGKPYKFTGAFAPVNQILGTLKFDKGKAELTEPDKNERSSEEPPVAPPQAKGNPRTVAIFTGRFQPFHSGHYSIYQEMVKRFGRENVFIATSDKTEAGKSPFRFGDKEQIMTRMFDIPEEMIVQVKNPYAPVEVLQSLPPNTTYVTAVSQKDADRLSGGKYFQPYDSTKSNAGYEEKGYFIVAPEMKLDVDGKNISGTQLRAIFGNPNISDEVKQEIFTKVYGKYDQDIFDKIVKTTTRSEEELKITKQFGGAPKKPKGKKALAVPPEKKEKPSAAKPEKRAAEYHKPGTTWPAGDKFGAKNKTGRIRYYNTQQSANKFAKS
jgi:hypothetical protein